MPADKSLLRDVIEKGLTLDELGPQFDALGPRYSGKVRENFACGDERIIVVSDRVSAFDRILGLIPFKGQVLNQLASYWFAQTQDLCENHWIATPDPQVMRVHQCTPIPVEMVVRGYLTGVSSTSIWTAYSRGKREFCGQALADGLQKHERLPENIVTPTTKAPKGEHDENVSPDELFARGLIEESTYRELERQCLELFAFGQELAQKRGLILVDTKYELGRRSDGTIVLIDEIHTPDSSRYWYLDSYDKSMAAGEDPKSLDKEYLRRWLAERGYRGEGAPPEIEVEVLVEAAARYIETYETVTGEIFVPARGEPQPRIARALGLDLA